MAGALAVGGCRSEGYITIYAWQKSATKGIPSSRIEKFSFFIVQDIPTGAIY